MGTSKVRWKLEEQGSHACRGLLRDDLEQLQGPDLADAVAALRMLETYSHRLGEPQSVPWGGGLFEIRRNEVRVFYVFEPEKRIRVLKLLIGPAAPGLIAGLRRIQDHVGGPTPSDKPLSEWLEALLAQRSGLRRQVRRAVRAMVAEHEAMLDEIPRSAAAD